MKHSLLRAQLIKQEDDKLKPYKDIFGKLTIGVGRNLDDNGISEDESAYLLENDIRRVEAEVTRAIPAFGSLDDVRQRVLANMCFNLGLGRLLKFTKTLAAVEARDWDRAADEMLDSTWARQVGARAVELAKMMRTGEG